MAAKRNAKREAENQAQQSVAEQVLEKMKMVLPPSQVVTQVKDMYNVDMMEASRIRNVRKQLWNLYTNNYDESFSSKLPSQSRQHLSTFPTSVDFLATTITEWATGHNNEWAEFIPEEEVARPLAPVIAQMWRYNSGKEQFDQTFESNLKAGLITNPIWKMYPVEDDTVPYPGYCKIEPVDARLFVRDASGFGEHCIQIVPVSTIDLQKRAVQYGFDQEAVARVLMQAKMGGTGQPFPSGTNASGTPQDQYRWVLTQCELLGIRNTEKYNRTVILLEYWGPFWNQSGDLIIPFGKTVIANGSECLLYPIPDPYRTGVSPFIDCDIVETPFSCYSKPPMQNAASTCLAETHALNMMLDNVAMAVSDVRLVWDRMFTADSAQKMSNGVPSGATLHLKGHPNDGVPIQTVTLGQFHPEIMSILDFLNAKVQESAATPDVVRGLSDMNAKEMTLGEARIHQAGAGNVLNGVVKGVEKRMLEPLLRLYVKYTLPRMQLFHPRMQSVCQEEIQSAVEMMTGAEQGAPVVTKMNAPDVWNEVVAILSKMALVPMEVRVTGISHVLQQADTMERVNMLLVFLQTIGFGTVIDPIKSSRFMTKLIGIRAADLFRDNWERLEVMQSFGALMPDGSGANPVTSPMMNKSLPPQQQTPTGQAMGNGKQRGPRVRKEGNVTVKEFKGPKGPG